ncbi:MAG TPA: hybrid sensor histidine kinase/response regulator, partial [Noviherbaspirillum sp.]|nr:hybrid sensor histidine kinase/response regulator [Noviherbaspirillum sp.]
IHILVVDDFPQNLVANEAILARPGLKVLKAASGFEALELLLEHEVALALVDVQMPGMDGFELAEMMRGNQRTSAIPIIFMTAAAEEATRSFRGYQAGAVDFLTKPVNPDVLRGKVEVFVELQAQKNQIREQVEELRRALQMNELFIAVLGHDLRTPLSAVLHGAELLKHIGGDARVEETAERIHASGTRMEKMVRQLLDVAQTRAAGVTLFKSKANLEDVCRRIIAEIEHRASASRIRIESSGKLDGLFDTDRMSQVISNLLGNALQHGRDGTPIRIELDGTDAGTIRLRLTNEGVIPPETLDGIFKPFYFPDRKRTPSAGLGLGLYIVHEFVVAHGGTVSVHSSPWEGTTSFEVALPRQ